MFAETNANTDSQPVVSEDVVAASQDQVLEDNQESEVIRAKAERLTGPNVVGKMQLPASGPKRNPVASSSNTNSPDHKRKRKRKDYQGNGQPQSGSTPAQQQANPPGHQQAHGGNRPDFRNRGGQPGGAGGNTGGNRPGL